MALLIFSTVGLSICSQLFKLLFITFYFTWTAQSYHFLLFNFVPAAIVWYNMWTLTTCKIIPPASTNYSFLCHYLSTSNTHSIIVFHGHMRTQSCVWVFLQLQEFHICVPVIAFQLLPLSNLSSCWCWLPLWLFRLFSYFSYFFSKLLFLNFFSKNVSNHKKVSHCRKLRTLKPKNKCYTCVCNT